MQWPSPISIKPDITLNQMAVLTEAGGKSLSKFCIFNFGMKYLSKNKTHKHINDYFCLFKTYTQGAWWHKFSQPDCKNWKAQKCAWQMYRFWTCGLRGWPEVPTPATSFFRLKIESWVCPAPSCFSPVCPPDGSITQKRKHWAMSLMYSKIGNWIIAQEKRQ